MSRFFMVHCVFSKYSRQQGDTSEMQKFQNKFSCEDADRLGYCVILMLKEDYNFIEYTNIDCLHKCNYWLIISGTIRFQED